MMTDCPPARLIFCRFDERFLERSWHWLQDAEIKRLTLTPDFTREQQRKWFDGLPKMNDYLVWGLLCEGEPIGAAGLKHIAGGEAEYWGYIGEREYWGVGLGCEIMRFIFEKAKTMGLRDVYLNVHQTNLRAIGLYKKSGFRVTAENGGLLEMRAPVVGTDGR